VLAGWLAAQGRWAAAAAVPKALVDAMIGKPAAEVRL